MSSERVRTYTWSAVSGLVGLLVVVASMTAPRLFEIDFNSGISEYERFPPLHANWLPEIGPRAVLPVLVAVAVLALWSRVERLGWPRFVAVTWFATWLWTFALAYVEGTDGLSRTFERDHEYLYDARRVTSVHDALTGFVDRIPLDAADHWLVHVAGHPPGALLAFVGLDRAGVTDEFWVGTTVMTLGTTAVVAGLVAVRALGGERIARRVAPWWVLAPLAVWTGVCGDALFMAVAAWGLALLALACGHTGRRLAGYGIAAGLVLGYCVYLSYGLVLLGLLAVAVLVAARTVRPLPWALGGALVVAAGFTVAGFAWWEAYPVLRERYYDGIAEDRPYSYWVWANLGAWTFTIGLATWAAFPAAIREVRRLNPVAVLGSAGVLCVVAATLSGMSKAEVERIWMPFTFWVLMLPALLPVRWRTPLLAGQAMAAVLVQLLLLTRW